MLVPIYSFTQLQSLDDYEEKWKDIISDEFDFSLVSHGTYNGLIVFNEDYLFTFPYSEDSTKTRIYRNGKEISHDDFHNETSELPEKIVEFSTWMYRSENCFFYNKLLGVLKKIKEELTEIVCRVESDGLMSYHCASELLKHEKLTTLFNRTPEGLEKVFFLIIVDTLNSLPNWKMIFKKEDRLNTDKPYLCRISNTDEIYVGVGGQYGNDLLVLKPLDKKKNLYRTVSSKSPITYEYVGDKNNFVKVSEEM